MKTTLLPLVGLALLAILNGTPALAQTTPPALPGAPPAPASSNPGQAAPLPTSAGVTDPGVVPEIIGQTYSVELRSGTSFLGVLRAIAPEALTFESKELGLVTVQRTNLRQLSLLTAEQARRGFDEVGNGNRLLFAPTARNLRRGEGYVQSAYVFLVGINYGVTDNFSIGTLFSFIPSAGSDNFFSLTPKLSFPVSSDLHLGAGAVLGVAPGGTFGITYANGTYGSADNNLTAGLGYGFANGAFASTPVFLLGGARRVSRRVSLMSETYVFHTADDFSKDNYVLGIAGVRVAAQRLSGSLGLLYAYYSRNYSNSNYYYSDSSSDTTVLPYAEISFRFGRVK